jgi:hypothetical protein
VLLVSVLVQYDPWQRMGNRMFQYAFGLIISKAKNIDFYHDGLPNFDIEKNVGTVASDAIKTSSFGYNFVDVDFLLNTKKDIIIDSTLQNIKYYEKYRELLKNAFSIKNNKLNNIDTLVLHIRETDYLQTKNFLGTEAYMSILSKFNYKNYTVVTDNANCNTVQELLKQGCTVRSKGKVDKFCHTADNQGMDDFFFLLNSSNIFLSQSSFSWWPAFLGEHENIYFPFSSNKKLNWPLHPDKDDIDLFFNFAGSKKFII